MVSGYRDGKAAREEGGAARQAERSRRDRAWRDAQRKKKPPKPGSIILQGKGRQGGRQGAA